MGVKENWVGAVTAVRRSFRFRSSSASPKKTCNMRLPSKLVGAVQRTFGKSPRERQVIVFHHTNNNETFTNEEEDEEEEVKKLFNEEEIVEYFEEFIGGGDGVDTFTNEGEEEKEQANEEQIVGYSKEVTSGGDGSEHGDSLSSSFEDLAAIKIQAFFRRHLARRAYRALRSLVKLQAVVRGAQVRSQARVALNCMNALARLQLRIRERQLFNSSSIDLS